MSDENKLSRKSKFVIFLFLALVLIAVFGFADAAVNSIDISTIAPVWVGPVTFLIVVFSSSYVKFAVIFVRNIGGYLYAYTQNYIQAGEDGKPFTGLEYKFSKFFKTFLYYGMGLTIVLVALPSPWKEVGTLVIIVIDLVKSEYSRIVAWMQP